MTDAEKIRVWLDGYTRLDLCPACGGASNSLGGSPDDKLMALCQELGRAVVWYSHTAAGKLASDSLSRCVKIVEEGK